MFIIIEIRIIYPFTVKGIEAYQYKIGIGLSATKCRTCARQTRKRENEKEGCPKKKCVQINTHKGEINDPDFFKKEYNEV